MKLEFFWTYLLKILKYQISWESVQWETSCSMRVDRETDREIAHLKTRDSFWPIRFKCVDPLLVWHYRQQVNPSKTLQTVLKILFEIFTLGDCHVNEAGSIPQSEASCFRNRTRHACLPRSATDCHKPNSFEFVNVHNTGWEFYQRKLKKKSIRKNAYI